MSGAKAVGAVHRRTKRYAWFVLSAVLAGAAGSPVALAQPDEPGVAQATARQFDIRAQSLDAALIEFARQSGVQVSAETSIVGGKRTAGISGQMTPDQALAALLAGTGLGYRRAGSMLVIENAPPSGAGIILDPVQVQGYPVPQQAMIDNLQPPYAGGQVATGGQLGLLGNRSVMDTPFNQSNYTAKKAQNQQAKTVQDVLKDDPSVRPVRPDEGIGAQNMTIRGFAVDTNGVTSYGGLFGMLPSFSIMAEIAERVEVLKGPSAMLNGMPPGGTGGVGGTVNIVPKRAPDEPLMQATANYVSAGQVGGHVDVARRFGSDKQFGIRLNGVFRAGQTEIQWNSDQRALALAGLDFRGERARFSADVGYQYQYIGGVMANLNLAAGVPLPWAPNVRTNPGSQPWNASQRKDLFGVFRGELDLTDDITSYVAFGAHDNRLEGLYTGIATITNGSGAATSSSPLNVSSYFTYKTAEAGLRALAGTGPIGHQIAFTATTLVYESSFGGTFGSAFATNVYTPTIIARPSLVTPAANKTGLQTLSSFGISDTLSAADKRIQLTAGARLQRVQAFNFDATTGAQTSSYDQGALSPSVSLVVKPFWENVSFYGNWIQALQPGTIVAPPFANAGDVFPPFKSTQYEAGVKVDWGKFTTTASLFQITQPFTFTNVAANTVVLGGEQRNQGLELNIFGEPVEGVRLLGGAMFLNAVLARTQGGLTDGWYAPFSPGFNFNLAGEWDLPFARGVTVNGRVVYTSSQYIDTTWPRRTLPEWARFDLGARYAFENPGAKGKLLVARFNVDNVLDTNYWAGGSNTLVLGAPRTFRLSLTADF